MLRLSCRARGPVRRHVARPVVPPVALRCARLASSRAALLRHPVYHTPVVHTRRVYDFAQWGLITLRIFAMIEMARQHNTSVSLGPRGLCTYYSYRISSLHVVSPRPQGAFSMPRGARGNNRGWLCAPVHHHNHRAGLAQPMQCMGPAGYSRAMDVAALAVSGWRYTRAARPRHRNYYDCGSGGGRELARRTTGGHMAGGPAAAACGQ